MKAPHDRLPLLKPSRNRDAALEPIFCTVGETLCQVRIWTEAEWDRLAPHERPTPAEFVPGLGWVGAVLRGSLS